MSRQHLSSCWVSIGLDSISVGRNALLPRLLVKPVHHVRKASTKLLHGSERFMGHTNVSLHLFAQNLPRPFRYFYKDQT